MSTDMLFAVLVAVAGGLAGGLVGVGGGVLFVPALTIFIGLSQVEGESTSLLMIVIVALVGAARQNAYGNLNLRDALVIGVLSPLGVLIGVVVANEIPQRALELSFAALVLFVAYGLVRHASRPQIGAARRPRSTK
ncbi:MAG TPA: sulfite exporter TauE/SafE family protein [Solirubrobacterales bacterium]